MSKPIEIVRIFAAPRELVFRAWTDPELLKRWYAPHGCTLEVVAFDAREGGSIHTCIHDPKHGPCWVRGEFREVVPPTQLAFTSALSNERGERVTTVEAGKQEDWPAETMIEVTFDEVEGGTKVTLRQNVSEELAKQTGAYPSWLQMLDRLERELVQAE